VVAVGPRQAGREHAGNVIHCAESALAVREAVRQARAIDRATISHPYGDGRAGERIADLLSITDPTDAAMRRKLNTY
jgi:UDP-N-acetylglucosamine 2-epimerase